MAAMPTRLRAEATLDADWRVVWHLTDLDRHFVMHVRRGVAEMRERPAEVAASTVADLHITTTAQTWTRVASGHRAAAAALASGELEVDGGITGLARLQGWFER